MNARQSPDELKHAVGRFASGVVILTVREGRDDVGLTATAFASVSLDPPLVLVSVALQSYLSEVLERHDTWAISVLERGQKHLAGRFAAAGRPSGRLLLASVPHHRGRHTDALIVENGLAALECRTHDRMVAGDHVLVVGQVLGIDYVSDDGRPLLHWDGRYHEL